MSTIFISSTFQDMHQERDILQSRVLPEIREYARQYGKNIDLCDLRWGVNSMGMDEETSTVKVLQVCFDEIDRARPFFVAILGDRYGWIPDGRIAESCAEGRTLSPEELEGKSVTEMEIIYGALKSERKEDVLFYFREIRNNRRFLLSRPALPAQYVSASADDRRRMQALKDKISERFPERLRTYRVSYHPETGLLDGMEEFAGRICRDLKQMLRARWGEPRLQSEYDRQYAQYRYAIDQDNYFTDRSRPFLAAGIPVENRKLARPVMDRQNYVLVSRDRFGLDRLFATLCDRYRAEGATVIPYDCGQSVLSSSTENMLRYFAEILRKTGAGNETGGGKSKEEAGENPYDHDRKQFQQALAHADSCARGQIILAIRGIEQLDEDDIFRWLPLEQFRSIHFLISSDKTIAGPSAFGKLSEIFYFPEGTIFNRAELIDAYMARYHKEIDGFVRNAILDRADGRDDQYMEFLMQRLLVMSRQDFQVIRDSGDGIQKISEHLRGLVQKAPASTSKILLAQVKQLEEEAGKEFTDAVLSILLLLPYGIARQDLEAVLKESHIQYNILNMTLLCRGLPSVINETLDGNYRVEDNSAAKALRQEFFVNEAKWGGILERYMRGLPEGTGWDGASETPGSFAGYVSREFYRSQYLPVARRAGKRDALHLYIQNEGHDVAYAALALRKCMEDPRNLSWLKENMEALDEKDRLWLTGEFYSYISDHKWIQNRTFGLAMIELWETMILPLRNAAEENTADRTEKSAGKTTGQAANRHYFRVLYEAGELAYLHEDARAEGWLLLAKDVARENFRRFPNRIWKMLHGMELTEEEKRLGYETMEQMTGEEVPEGITFGFSGEMEDVALEQSWSPEVRVINNYLAAYFRKTGKTDLAEQLEEESKYISHMADPDPQNQGQTQVNEYTTILWPDQLAAEEAGEEWVPHKRAYKPDYRRNSAIQMAKDAQRLVRAGDREGALKKYRESCDILMEIYEDGKTGEYYDLLDVVGNMDEIRVQIQKECARDLCLNYQDMVPLMEIVPDNRELTELVDGMISWAHIYDDYRNNRQSKTDLEECYLLSARVYLIFQQTDLYWERILRDIEGFLTYRLEAHQKGAATDQRVMDRRRIASQVLYEVATHISQQGAGTPQSAAQASQPDIRNSQTGVQKLQSGVPNSQSDIQKLQSDSQTSQPGTQITDMLLRQTNATVKANDFDGYVELVQLTGALLVWTWDHGCEWKGTLCSLEYMYISSMDNLCTLWRQNRMEGRFENDAKTLAELLPRLKEPLDILMAIKCVLSYQVTLFQKGEYDKALAYVDEDLRQLARIRGSVSLPELVNLYGKITPICSEAGDVARARKIGLESERILEQMEREGYRQEYAAWFTPDKFRSFVIREKVTLYLNSAVICSRTEEKAEGMRYLDMAEEYVQKYPEILASNSGLIQRIRMQRKIMEGE